MKDQNKEIGERIQKIRELKKLTVEQLADRLNITPNKLRNIEKGITKIKTKDLVHLCLLLHISSDYILLGKRPMELF